MRSAQITYLLLGLILSLLFSHSALAQNSGLSQIPDDSSEVSVRTIDSGTLAEISEERVFEYNELPQNPDSLMNRIIGWLFQLIAALMDSPWASIVIRVVFFTIFGIVLIALINQILGGNLSSTFSAKKSNGELGLNIKRSDLKHTNYDELLNSALSENRYRDAVRILYLKALQQLNEAELILWKADKTNHDYLRELGDHPSRSAFSRLTSYYEYVEYGDFRIEQKGFQNVRDVYKKFQEMAGRS